MTPSKNENPFERWAGATPAFENEREVGHWVRELRDEESEEREPFDLERPSR